MFWDQEPSDFVVDSVHTSHVMHYTNETWYDKFCINCGETNQVPKGLSKLVLLCPNEPEQHRIARLLGASDEFIKSTEQT